MEIAFTHSVRYASPTEASINAIAQSLMANDDVLKLVPRVLEQLYPGLAIAKVDFNISRLSKRSPLHEHFDGTLYAQLQQSIDDVISGAARLTGVDVLARNKRAVSSLVMLLLVGGAISVLYNMLREPPARIVGNYNTILTITADSLGRESAEIERALQNALNDRDRRALSRSASDFVAPARNGGSVEVEGAGSLDPETVSDIPTRDEIDEFEGQEFLETRENLEIYVRAFDLDQTRRGWAGIIDVGEGKKRVRMVILPGIRLDVLTDQSIAGPIRGDVHIFYRRGRDGEWQPYVMHLYRLHPKAEIGAKNEPKGSEEAT